ncbi:MAG: AAA family ATPase [Patescibacteria group bacterium]|jgi:AAA15 family ATPase/GTPase
MFIKNLSIKNFRSIKEISIDPANLCAVIGSNSSGKTNILKAMDLILGEGWTTKAKVAKELFNDVNKPIEIIITFNEAIEFKNARGYPISISSIKLEMILQPELSVKTTINDGVKFYDQEQFKRLCHFIYIPSERKLSSELKVSQWTMLGKLMKLIYENYVVQHNGNEQDLKNKFAEKIKPAKDFLEDDFSTEKVTFKKFVDVFKKFCKENSAGLANEFEPVLDIYNLNWFYKTLQVHVKESFPDRNFDSDEVGTGMQNLLLVSIFQTYAELMGGKVIFGIEEPEIYLYPQAQRSLYKNFIGLSKNTQIFYTTHNPNFVDASRPDDMLLLRKDREKGTYKLEKNNQFNSQIAEHYKYKIYTHFNPERNEMFFAKKVIFVEGDSDKILVSTLCQEKWNIDLDLLGISLISCSGKSGVNYFIGVCKLIGLEEYFAIWDSDDDDYNPDKDLLAETIKNNKGIEIPNNLETFLKLPTNNKTDKVKNANNWAINIEQDKIPNDFLKVKQFIDGSELIPNQLNEIENDPDDIPF